MAYSVSFITKYIRSLLEGDMHLSRIEVEGEISDITYHGSGNVFFTLKESDAILTSIMFKSDASALSFKPKTGDRVIAKGRITTYEARGNYQLVARSLTPAGEGDLYKRFLELKNQLSELGMFSEEYKRPIPRYIKTLGVITSPTGAAIRDIINITKRRNPFVQIILYPALVQGEGSVESLVEGILEMDRISPDVIILGRGGGSMEDLWSFNEEAVARAVFACNTPVISAVGHETDYLISDFVADLRAPTPSAAAELAVYDYYDLKASLEYTKQCLFREVRRGISDRRQKALAYGKRLELLSPAGKLTSHKTKLVYLEERLNTLMISEISKKRENLKRLAAGLNALSPAARLSQGYSYVTDEKGKNIKEAGDLNTGDVINVRLSKGSIEGKVTKIWKNKP